MRLITVRTISAATLSALLGICAAVALVTVRTTFEAVPGIEASPAIEASRTIETSLRTEALPGIIAGQVTDLALGVKLENAFILLEDAGIGALTNSDGRFVIANVPVGRHTLTIKNLGYAEQQQEVTVVEGRTTVADLEMKMVALQLNDLIISSSAAGRSNR